MPMPTTRSLLYVRSDSLDAVVLAIRAFLRKQGYRTHNEAIPRGYLRQALEVKEWLVAPPNAARWVMVAPEERDRIFYWGRDISEAARTLPVLALTIDPFGAWRAKTYFDGKPLTKLGADPDDEFLYPVAEADERAFEHMERVLGLDKLRTSPFRWWWQELLTGAAKDVGSFAASLELPAPTGSFPELRADESLHYECWLRRGSPLLDL